MNARAQAARFLAPVLRGQGSLGHPTDLGDAALVAELCYGTLRFAPRLTELLKVLLSKPLRAKDADIEALLLVGLYQLEQTRIPDHAAVDECVTAARQLGKSWAAGMVNAVLRNRLRRAAELERQLENNAVFRWAHPSWMIDALFRQWPIQAEAILGANNQRPPMTLRVNLLKQTRDQYLQRLQEAGIVARLGKLSAAAITLEQPCAVSALPGFEEGCVSVQDEAAQLCAELLSPAPGQRVLDACAAPGGKSCHLKEFTPGSILVACDIDSERLQRVAQNLLRLGLEAELECCDCGDAEAVAELAPFDQILLDAPCSGTGVIRRHPDIKLVRRPGDISQFVAQQERLLDALWPRLKPHGLLLYVTCSIMPEENAELIDRYLARCGSAQALPIAAKWGVEAGVGRQLLPAIDGTDGFYFALLRKTTG